MMKHELTRELTGLRSKILSFRQDLTFLIESSNEFDGEELESILDLAKPALSDLSLVTRSLNRLISQVTHEDDHHLHEYECTDLR